VALVEVLAEYGISEQEVVEVFKAQSFPPGGAATFTKAEAEFLTRFGGVETSSRSHADAAEELARVSLSNTAALATTSISVQEAAKRLGISASRVSHRVADKGLYAYKFGARLRLPLWQFDDADTKPLPHLRDVLASLPADLHPLEVHGLMTVPKPDLEIDEKAYSPRAWLLAGGDPQPVLELLREPYSW
jgi:excisionase family DNA binding protein